MKKPLEHRIIKPFKYVPSEHSDIAVTIRRAQAVIAATRKAEESQQADNVRSIPRKERKAA